jgi:aminoglycoside phosphotransferase (APT) family kinase protein
MTTEIPEIPLTGGRTTSGIVRVGDTARRPATANSDFVRRLLRHLERKGFEAVPRVQPQDEKGRDVFSFIEGEVPSDLAHHSDQTIAAAARVIRQYHDLTTDFVSQTSASDVSAEVVCHNDLSPCNFVFRSARPVAIIDFDATAPGTRADDLGYAAWMWLDIGSPEIASLEQECRLAVFLDAYGRDEATRGAVLEAMLVRQEILAAEGQTNGDWSMRRWAEECRTWTRANLTFA